MSARLIDWTAAGLFGGHVAGSTHNDAGNGCGEHGGGIDGIDGGFRGGGFSESEIEDFDEAIGGDFDVGGFEVAVGDAFIVGGFEGFGDLTCNG